MSHTLVNKLSKTNVEKYWQKLELCKVLNSPKLDQKLE